jgi:hypothetical protein
MEGGRGDGSGNLFEWNLFAPLAIAPRTRSRYAAPRRRTDRQHRHSPPRAHRGPWGRVRRSKSRWPHDEHHAPGTRRLRRGRSEHYPGTAATSFEENALRAPGRDRLCPREKLRRTARHNARAVFEASKGAPVEKWLDRSGRAWRCFRSSGPGASTAARAAETRAGRIDGRTLRVNGASGRLRLP